MVSVIYFISYSFEKVWYNSKRTKSREKERLVWKRNLFVFHSFVRFLSFFLILIKEKSQKFGKNHIVVFNNPLCCLNFVGLYFILKNYFDYHNRLKVTSSFIIYFFLKNEVKYHKENFEVKVCIYSNTNKFGDVKWQSLQNFSYLQVLIFHNSI